GQIPGACPSRRKRGKCQHDQTACSGAHGDLPLVNLVASLSSLSGWTARAQKREILPGGASTPTCRAANFGARFFRQKILSGARRRANNRRFHPDEIGDGTSGPAEPREIPEMLLGAFIDTLSFAPSAPLLLAP